MANYTITITNSVNTFGPAPSDKWNQYNWNVFKWGEGTNDLQVALGKVISNSLSLDSTAAISLGKLISNSLSPASDMLSEELFDAAGYNYVFASNTVEGESRYFPTWTASSRTSSTWTAASAAASSWSAAA